MNLKLNIQRVTLILVVLFVVGGTLIVVLDWSEIKGVISQADWLLLLPAFIAFSTSAVKSRSLLKYNSLCVFVVRISSVGFCAGGFVAESG